jgi:DNA-binding PadR family transcriptional regulator
MTSNEEQQPGWPGDLPRWIGEEIRRILGEVERGKPWAGPWVGPRHHHGPGRRGRFAAGPGFAWGWGGPGPKPRRSRRGDVRLAVLSLLAEQPMHGYQIITELAGRSGGAWQPSPGSIYPTLQQLADEGLVTVSESDGRRTFSLTDAGREELERASAGRRPPWEGFAGEGGDEASDLRERAAQVMAAAAQVAAAGSDRQIDAAASLLTDCRRALYRLLAEEEAEEA